MKKKLYSLWIEPEQLKHLREFSARTGLTTSKLIRNGIDIVIGQLSLLNNK